MPFGVWMKDVEMEIFATSAQHAQYILKNHTKKVEITQNMFKKNI